MCLNLTYLELEYRGPFLERPEKPFVKLRPVCSVKLVFSYVVKGGIKIKITAKFRASRRLRFEDTRTFGTFEKRAPGRMLRNTSRILMREENRVAGENAQVGCRSTASQPTYNGCRGGSRD